MWVMIISTYRDCYVDGKDMWARMVSKWEGYVGVSWYLGTDTYLGGRWVGYLNV